MPPRATPLPADERRQAIIDVVLPLLLDHGREVTTRQIAEAAGIAEGTIFRVFPDKDALWHAVAEQTLDPEAERRELAEVLVGITDLPTKIERIADHLLERSQRVMAVLMVLRRMWMRDGGEPGKHGRAQPAYLVEANRSMMLGLTAVFEEHRDELAVPPETAAMVLRSLVLGQRHPGAHADSLVTPAEVAMVMLHGVQRKETR